MYDIGVGKPVKFVIGYCSDFAVGAYISGNSDGLYVGLRKSGIEGNSISHMPVIPHNNFSLGSGMRMSRNDIQRSDRC